MSGRAGQIVSRWLAFGVGAVLVATIATWTVQTLRKPKPEMQKVIVGSNDQVYYARGATMQDATTLGHALQSTGFFNDQGTSVMFTRTRGIPIVSFVLNEGGWDNPAAVAAFEEIGRRIATSVGGFPIQVHLTDAAWNIRKSLVIGKTNIGTKDVIYFLGSATEAQAKALGQALRDAGYLRDLGVTVVIAKGDTTSLGFVVGDGVWDRPQEVAAFERLGRRAAPAAGGLPLQLRLLNAQMEPKKETTVR
jgi:hypothetical protein